MAKINEITFECRVLAEPKTKTFNSGKTVHEIFTNVYAGKDSGGNHQNAPINIKYWGNTPPSKGQDIIVKGKLKGECWINANGQQSKLIIECDRWTIAGQNAPENAPQQDAENQDDLPF